MKTVPYRLCRWLKVARAAWPLIWRAGGITASFGAYMSHSLQADGKAKTTTTTQEEKRKEAAVFFHASASAISPILYSSPVKEITEGGQPVFRQQQLL